MKSRLILLFCLFSIPFLTKSQEFEAIDYHQLQKNISDPESKDYYPELLKQYQIGNSLTLEQYRTLYYGFTFQDTYRPYDRDPRDQQISDLIGAGLDQENTPQLIEISKDYLNDSPFNLKIINYLQNFLAFSNDTTEIDILTTQYDGIINAILSSGNGISKETGYSVNHPSDEYMVLRAKGLTAKGNEFETTYDYYSLEENDESLTGIYFDVYQMAKVGTAHLGIETIQIENETIPEDGIMVGSRDEILSFIPLGFEVIDELNIDFDNDDDLDWILVLKKEGEETLSNSAAGDPEPRLLTILERSNENKLVEKLSSSTVIPCIDCGDGSEEDPYQGVHFEDGILTISSSGGTMFKWQRESSFKYDEHFYLITEQFKTFRKGKENQAQVEKETVDDFGVIPLTEYDYR